MNRKKELKAMYKARKVVGGVYRIVNRENGRYYLQGTDDMQATRNWFAAVHKFGGCPLPPLQRDWQQYGMDAFELDELDYLEKKEEQGSQEFQRDIKALLELWSEKLPQDSRY